ncbi:MAG TPA: hypothetical protein VKD22_16725, partial [Ramlibacter sp.]|nr:hypothetical protein [Ramlibacter sp.]
MAFVDLYTQACEAPRRRGFAAIGTGHRITEVVQHFGNPAHAGTTNADEMHAPEIAHDPVESNIVALCRTRRHFATSKQISAMRAAASGF